MSQIVKEVHNQIRASILEAAGRAVSKELFTPVPLGDFKIEVPANREFGDYSANAAMAWARDLHMPPKKIAEIILDNIDIEDTLLSRCESAGAGFINFYLSPAYYASIVSDVLAKGAQYGSSDFGNGKRINVEFVSANPTGPMHMGNARGGALGDCLAAVLQKAGYDVTREFYVNDAGNQIDKFALSLNIRYQQLYLGDKAPELPEDSYHGEDIAQRAKEFASIYGDRYIGASEQERLEALVDFALPKNIDAMKANLTKYRIEYDTWFLESTLHNDGELADTIELMKSKGLTYESDGALWYRATEHGGEKDEVLIRANGNPTYFAADIAYHRNKFAVRSFDRAVNIWGADHHGHVARMKGALDAIGLDGSKLDIILMQLVRLTRDGEVVRMSKRTGKAITLVDLLEDIPIDAVRFLFNMREPGTQMDFDLDLAVEQSSQNPVYYCQYAHARICSILRKLESDGGKIAVPDKKALSLLCSDEEKELISHLASLTGTIISAAVSYDPAKITHYAVELATKFHRFYNAQRVMTDDEELKNARIFLCVCVRDTMKNVLEMLKISAPESM